MRQGLTGKAVPHICRAINGHLRLDAGRLSLSFGEDFGRGQTGVQLELELASEQRRTDAPFIGRARQNIGL